MIVKVLYLNGCWEYLHGVKSISYDKYHYLVELENGAIKKYDSRLKLEICLLN